MKTKRRKMLNLEEMFKRENKEKETRETAKKRT